MPVIAKGGSGKDFERVVIKEWIEGEIVKVEERLNPRRKYRDEETDEWKYKEVQETRFKFTLIGYEYHHYSRWVTLSTDERSNLFSKYLRPLLGDKIEPNDTVDLEKLEGLKVRTMWDETKMRDGRMFQFVAMIDPLEKAPDIRIEEPYLQEKEEITPKDLKEMSDSQVEAEGKSKTPPDDEPPF